MEPAVTARPTRLRRPLRDISRIVGRPEPGTGSALTWFGCLRLESTTRSVRLSHG